jgi:RHS repeat-associated protein
LAGSSGSFVTTYIYDAANRLQFSLSGGQLTTYTWDLRGNLTSDGSQSYTYDQANRLVKVSAIGKLRIWQAGYNGDGARVWTSYQSGRSPTIVTDDILDLAAPLPVVLVKGDPRWPGLDTPRYYVYAQGTRPLAEYNSNPDPIIGGEGEWIYYLPDGLGSVRQEVDAAGVVLTERRFDPYGVPLDGDGGTPFGYTGEQYDADTGLIFLRARYYDPVTGRFTQQDPLHASASSLYVYASDNPVRFRDPTGKVDCGTWPGPLRSLCEEAENGNLDAMETIYRLIVAAGGARGGDYILAGSMMAWYLDGQGKDYVICNSDIVDPMFCLWRLDRDPNIVEKVDEYLVSVFIGQVLKPAAKNALIRFSAGQYYHSDQVFVKTEDRPNTRPAPISPGLFAAVGHVPIDAMFKADVELQCGTGEYIVRLRADYAIDDKYEWFHKKETQFSEVGIVIPHEWALALRDANPPRAHEYNFYYYWSRYERLLIDPTWTYWRRLAQWERFLD